MFFIFYTNTSRTKKHSRSYEIGLSHIPCLYEKWYAAAAKKNKAIYYMNIAAVRDNHLDAQYQLAHLYECLKSPNYKEAVKWYTVAAKRGHNKAQVMLGKMYYFGHGVEKNLHEAEKWLNLSLKREYSLQAHQILTGCIKIKV